MKLLIIVPAHNEENHIFFCLQSLRNQTFRDFEAVVVNDGSSDGTAKIIDEFISQDARFSVLHLEKSAHAPGSKVVEAFKKGLQAKKIESFDVICKFDADIIFPGNYLEKIVSVYSQNPKAGMVSGLVQVKRNVFDKKKAFDFGNESKAWIFEDISSKNHVRGPIKSYRRDCLVAMGGLRSVLGWDNIDVMLAEMHGFQVITVKDLWVKHLRPTAFKYKNQKAEKLGEYYYNIGLNLPLAAAASAKSALKNRSLREFFITMRAFWKNRKKHNVLTEQERRYIRVLRWKRMIHRK